MNPGARRRLLAWYDARRRRLPWRRDRNPYRVWVSEVMLQQTRVETVVPYFERFLERFPTLDSLARAEVDEVLALWSGLGYYRRARQLHEGARRVVAAGGAMPRTAEGLRRLPGIGPYTASAVASIAFGAVEPAVDGNVERVVARRLALAGNPRRAAARRRLHEAARGLLDSDRPGDSNQALMELGATVCTPRAPRCPECPLRRGCRAAAAGEAERYPRLPGRRAPVRVRRLAAVARHRGRVLLVRRDDGEELLAGLWELPWVELAPRAPAAARALERRLAERYGGSWRLGPPRGTVRHAITFRALEVEVREATVSAGETLAEGPEAGWFSDRDLAALAVSSLVRKVLARAA